MIKFLGGAAIAAITLSAGSEACSVAPAEVVYDEYMERLRQPTLARFIQAAHSIEIATPIAYRTTDTLDERDLMRRDLPQTYTFAVVEQLKGSGPDSYESRFDDHHFAVAPTEEWLDWVRAQTGADNWFASPEFWDLGGVADLIGTGVYGAGDCSDAVLFDLDADYLVMRDEDGVFLSAVRIDRPDHPWLIATRTSLIDPTNDRPWRRSLADHVAAHPRARVFRVTDCNRPLLEIEWASPNAFGSVGELHEDSGPHTDFVDYLEETQTAIRAPWLSPETNEHQTRARWEYLDSRRFEPFPFSSVTCELGARYLELATLQLFPVSSEGMIDFSAYATQVELTGPAALPLADVTSWLAEE